MPLEIRPYSIEWRAAVREFNGRIHASGMQLPEDPRREMIPGSGMHVAVEDGLVRGGYVLRPQQFFFRGEPRQVAHYRLPISEGIVDKRYARVGAFLLRSALRTEPLLYALGMGGYDNPLPRMLQAMGWRLSAVPFYFHVVHPGRFLQKVRAIRKTPWRAALMDWAAWTGVGWLGIQTLQWRREYRRRADLAAKEVDDFAGWADELWEACRTQYGMAAARDGRTLRALYSPRDERFILLRVNRKGWAILIDTPMQGDQYFGDLRVGTIVDALARPEDAGGVIAAARRDLEQRGVDLIVSNQSHRAWTAALYGAGFLEGPSNFLFGASKELAAIAGLPAEMHINRGDGDGPVHL
jgi:hypothetical protein